MVALLSYFECRLRTAMVVSLICKILFMEKADGRRRIIEGFFCHSNKSLEMDQLQNRRARCSYL